MGTFNGLPIYEDLITDEGCGMLRISLVDLPAVESDFQKFGKVALVKMADEERRLIVGCVMRADFPIYRRDSERGEYYTRFSKETIRTMAEKYLAENRQNRVNLMHGGEEVRGVQMVQLFIKDTERGIAPSGFEDIEDGSLFAEFKIHDENIWNWIREGILRGFSLEGFFTVEESITEDMKINFEKVKAMLAKIVSKFAQITTDKGVLTCEGEPEVGKDVYFLEESGEVTDANDGEYKTEDGRVIVVAESKIAEIRNPEETPAEQPVEAAEEMPEGEVADDIDIHNLAAEVERIKGELEHKKEEIAELKDRVAVLEGKSEDTQEALRKMTAAKPAAEEIKGEEKSAAKFRNAHENFLFELNKSR